jgi:hypothetical protein
MGTNYYVELEKCPCCGHSKKRLHLGKLSAGWVFALQVLPDEGLSHLCDWSNLITQTRAAIVDEYGEAQDWPTLLHQFRTRRWERPWEPGAHSGYTSEAEFHRTNHSMRGPNNLLRSQIDGVHCVGHDGMFDLIVGDFS